MLLVFLAGLAVGIAAVLIVTALQPRECLLVAGTSSDTVRFAEDLTAGWVLTSGPSSGPGIYCLQKPLIPSTRSLSGSTPTATP